MSRKFNLIGVENRVLYIRARRFKSIISMIHCLLVCK